MKNISVIGIGRLGLCFALTLEKAGYDVVGVDINKDYIDSINNKTLNSSEKDVNLYLSKSKNFKATDNLSSALEHSDMLFVVVATPSLSNGRYDHDQIDSLIVKLEAIGKQSKQKNLVICCTVMPGYTSSITDRLNTLGYTVSYNPEFIAQGTVLKNQACPDMILIGEANMEVGELIEEIYKKHTENEPVFCRMSPTEAEITKISLNCFLTTKIAYANMIGDIVSKSGGRPDVVLKAIGSDSRIGNRYLGYGFGYGGPCFPRDNRALAIYAKDIDMPALIGVATDESNKLHLRHQVSDFTTTHNKNEPVVFDFVTYKPESDMLIESQQLLFAVKLAETGYSVTINEREEVVNELKQTYDSMFTYNTREKQ